jgi:hypothetical protein
LLENISLRVAAEAAAAAAAALIVVGMIALFIPPALFSLRKCWSYEPRTSAARCKCMLITLFFVYGMRPLSPPIRVMMLLPPLRQLIALLGNLILIFLHPVVFLVLLFLLAVLAVALP